MSFKNAWVLLLTVACFVGSIEPSFAADGVKPKAKAAGDQPANVVVNFACPIFPILTDVGGTLYYADLYPDTCMPPVQATYIYVTSIAWPYSNCSGAQCISVAFDRKKWETGLPDFVPQDYMHNDPDQTKPNHLPPESAALVGIEPGRSTHFVEFKLPERETMQWAKVLEFNVPRVIAGGKHETLKQYVAFEVKTKPVGENVVITPLEKFSPIDGYLVQGRTKIDLTHFDDVLVLLHTKNPAVKGK